MWDHPAQALNVENPLVLALRADDPRPTQTQYKFVVLASLLRSNLAISFGQELLREIMWGAMQRAHLRMFPLLLKKQRLAHFLKQLHTEGDYAYDRDDTALRALHKRWLDLRALLQTPADDAMWAALVLQRVPHRWVNRLKLLAVVKCRRMWEHVPAGPLRHIRWLEMLRQGETAEDIQRQAAATPNYITRNGQHTAHGTPGQQQQQQRRALTSRPVEFDARISRLFAPPICRHGYPRYSW